ncbi:hypothetical protein ACGV4K_24665 [Streptomyces sp. WAC8370]|uniref:hypothetical protein n=1 Tax=Streptomyces sp. WAC8370 TaxID=3351348 RepID=UPI003F7A27DD
MSLTALRHAEAFDTGRAVPAAALRHLHVEQNPFVVAFHVLAGEPFALLGITWGSEPARPAGYAVVAEPRNRDLRYAGLEAFAQALNDHVAPYLQISCDGRGQPQAAAAPQIVVPNAAAADALVQVAGRGVRYSPGAPIATQWAAAHLTFLGLEYGRAGQAMLVPATTALRTHWVTGQAGVEDENLAALLAWIDPDPAHTSRAQRIAAIAAAEKHAWGPLRDPAADRDLMTLVIAHGRARPGRARDFAARRIIDAVMPELRHAYSGTHRAMQLLRTLELAPSAAARANTDRSNWAYYAKRCTDGVPRFSARDSVGWAPVNAAALEDAANVVPAQMAYDDPLVMAVAEDTGAAFTGEVVYLDEENRERRKRNRVKVPMIVVRTPDRPAYPHGTRVRWAAHPGMVAEIRSTQPDQRQPGDHPDDRPYLVELAFLAKWRAQPLPAEGQCVTFATSSPESSGRFATGPIPSSWTHERQGVPA